MKKYFLEPQRKENVHKMSIGEIIKKNENLEEKI